MGDRYEMVRELGSGGTGTIWLVYDHFIHRYVALKELNGGKEEWILQSLQRELHILAMLEHERIPRIVDCIQLKGKEFMVMEYVDGVNLKELVESTGVLPESQVLDIGIQLCDILGYLHTRKNRILYLDLKPQNIMLTERGMVKLIDFGSAREFVLEKVDGKDIEMRIGTYGYAAPELLLEKEEEIDEKTDIYSLGATLFYLITGIDPAKPPYEIKPVRQWNRIVSKGMENIIKTCTEKKPEKRFQNIEEVSVKLKEGKKIFGINELKEYFKFPWILPWKWKHKFLLKQEKNIFCTEKKRVGLWGVLLGICCLLSTNAMVSYAARDKLLVNIRDEMNQKLLIKEGAIYYTEGSILFEIPKQQMLQEEEYEFTIISKNLASGQEKERKILIVSQLKEDALLE